MKSELPEQLSHGLSDALGVLGVRLDGVRRIKGWHSLEASMAVTDDNTGVLTLFVCPIEGHGQAYQFEDFNSPAIFAEFLNSIE